MGLWIPGGLSNNGGSSYVPCDWGTGTDEEIVEALEKHYSGEVDLTEYWSVGDERTVSLSAMSATGVGESHVAQDVTFVLMNAGGKQLVTPLNSISECAFIVGQKNLLSNGTTLEYCVLNSSTVVTYWSTSSRRTWCNNVYYNAIPSTLKSIFKEFQNSTDNGSNSIIINDYFSLPAEKELFGSNTYSQSSWEQGLSQFKYYETSTNRSKKVGNNGNNSRYWTRSRAVLTNNAYQCIVGPSGTDGSAAVNENYTYGVAPFGVI